MSRAAIACFNGNTVSGNSGLEVISPRQPQSCTASRLQPQASRREADGRSVLNGITRQFATHTPQLKRMLAELEVAAGHDVTVLLIGETGVGKTYLSRLIHEVSPRRNEPFLTVACGALPADLIESELFGHVKGAFTSAHADKDGKFLAARGGTILLDEIDVLAPKQQAKLLRVIEAGEFEPVGSNQTIKSQARVIVASNRDLEPLVEQGQFRADLYYRLNMLKFEVPPLRQRTPDIEMLARMFIREMSAKHGVEIARVEDDVFVVLEAYPWPGNVRELENVIQRAVIYCRDGVLRNDQLPPNIFDGVAGPANDPSVDLADASSRAESRTLNRRVASSEREIIEEALSRNNFSRTNTAKDLGISRVTLYNKMKKYGMSK
jgi:DNA-binding NtrC family response regulator